LQYQELHIVTENAKKKIGNTNTPEKNIEVGFSDENAKKVAVVR